MNKARSLKIISVITFIEIIASVVWPLQITLTQHLGVAAPVIWVIFAVPFIYYIVFQIFLASYSTRHEDDQNIGLLVFLNVLPIIGLVYILDLF